MEDVLGLGKGSEKLIDVIAKAIGVIYKPYSMRREAEAKAYEIKVIEAAKTEKKADAIRVLAEAKRDEVLIIDSANTTLEERAENRKRFDKLRRQSNLENVINGAFKYVGNESSSEPVDPDWLQALISYAEEANSDQMQDLWSKVLAGETELPGSFSLRSLEILKKMSRKDASIFQATCQIASQFETGDSLMVVETFRNAGIASISEEEIELQKSGVGLYERMTLSEIGLLHKDCIICSKFKPEGFKFKVAGHLVAMVPKSDKASFTIYQFTQTGYELAKLISREPHTNYFEEFQIKGRKAFSIDCQP